MVFLSTMQESLLPTDATTTATGNCRNEFYFIAEPNTTGRRRTIYLNGMVMNCSFSRIVMQDK